MNNQPGWKRRKAKRWTASAPTRRSKTKQTNQAKEREATKDLREKGVRT